MHLEMEPERRSGNERRVSRRSERLGLRSIVDRVADGIVIVSLDGTIRFTNPAAERLFGRSADDLAGSPFGFPLIGAESAEIDLVRRRGESLSVELRAVDIDWEGVPARLVSLRDVTDRKRAEETARHLAE